MTVTDHDSSVTAGGVSAFAEPSPDTKQLREQVAKQCEAVCRLATVLAEVHQDYALVMRNPASAQIVDLVGRRTAHFMEVLGDMLNGMDAACEEDRWLDPIFEEAQRLWPTPPATDASRQDAGDVTDAQ